MKKTNFKKALSVFLSVLMLMSCWVWVTPTEAEAATTELGVTTSFTLSPEGNRGTADWTRLALTGESSSGGTSVVLFRFTNSDLNTLASTAKIELQFYAYSCANRLTHIGGTPVNADVYYITSNGSFVSKQGTNKSANVTDTGNSVLGTNFSGSAPQNSAKNYFGLSDATKVGTFVQPAINGQGDATLRTGVANCKYDVTNIVKQKAAAGEDLSFIVMLQTGYSCSGTVGWSDIYINSDTVKLAGITADYQISSINELKTEIEYFESCVENDGNFYTNMNNNYRAYNDAKRYYDAVVYGGVPFDASLASWYYSELHNQMYNHTGLNSTYVNYLNANITSRDGSAVSAAYRKNVIWYPWDFAWDITSNNARPTVQDTYFYFTMPNTIVGITSDSETTFPLHSFFWTTTDSRFVRYVIAGSGTLSSGVVGSSDFATMAPWKISNNDNRHGTSGLAPGSDEAFGDWVFEKNYRTDVYLDNAEDNSNNFSYNQDFVYQISSYAQINKSSVGVNASNVYKKVDQGFTFATSNSGNGGSTKYGNHYASNYSNYGGALHVVYMDTYKNNYENWKPLFPALSYSNYNGYVYSNANNVTTYLDEASALNLSLGLQESQRAGSIDSTVTTWATNVNRGAKSLANAKSAGTTRVTNKYVDLINAIKAADSLYSAGNTKYTAASWNAFKTAYEAARSHMAALNPSGSNTQYSSDTTTVGNLATALQNAKAALQYVTITYKYYNGTVAKTLTAADGGVLIGTTAAELASAAPDNTADEMADNANHYTYSWPTFSNVTDSATYQETRDTEAHQLGDYIIDKAATCTTEGSKHKECANCDYVTAAETISTIAHTEEVIPAVPATCTTPGKTEGKKCSVCGTITVAQQYTELAAHTEEVVTGKPASCTETGLTDGKICAVCGEILVAQEEIPMAAHTEELVPGKAATCTETGLTDGKKCSVCGETLVAQEEIPMAAHTEELVPGKAATCTETGLTDGKKCSVCGETLVAQETTPTIDHNLGDWITDKEPTCVTPGSKHKKCANCAYTTTEAIPATGNHVYGDWAQFNNGTTHRRTCTVDVACTAYEEEAHNFNGALKQLGGNFHNYKCEKCEAYGVGSTLNIGEECFGEGTTYDQIVDNDSQHKEICKCGREQNGGHAYGGWAADPENTTDNQGKMSRTCTECNYKQTTSCTYTVTDEKPATCTEDGYKTWECKDCGNGYSEILTASGHIEGEAVEENRKESSCTVAGSYESVVYCSVCNERLSSETVELPLAEHTEGEAVEENRKESSCTVAGSYDLVVYCSKCNEKLSSETVELPLAEHTEGEAVEENRTESSCTVAGSYDSVVYCSKCNAELDRDTIDLPLADHTPAEAVEENRKESSCTVAGSYDSVVYCSKCNAELDRDTVDLPLAEHTPAEAVEENRKESSCTVAGSYDLVVYCSKCNEKLSSETIDLPLAEHTPAEAVEENRTESSCTVAGSYDSVVYCSKCNAELDRDTVDLPLAEHTPAEAVEENRKESSCTVAGSYDSVVYCSVCNEKLSSETVELPLAEHTEGEAVEENRTESTCTVAGSYDLVVYCSKCNEKLSSETIDLPLAEHTPAEAVEENRTESSCTVAGSYDSVVYCSKCNAELDRDTVDLPLAEHTPAEAVEENRTESSCTVAGSYESVVYCSKCNAELDRDTIDFPLAEHNWGNATCDAPATCTVCGATTGDKLGHDWEDTTYNFAADGSSCSAERVCQRADCGVTETATAEITSAVKTPATCIEKGTTTYTATFEEAWAAVQYKDVQDIAIDADKHTKLNKTDAVEETCEEDGNIDYWTCEGCNKIYSDTAATQEITEADTVIAAKGHNYGAWTYDADGNHKRVCANDANHVETEACADTETDNDCLCDKCSNLVAHNYGEASCDAPATCTVCGATTGDKLGHDWEDTTYNFAADGSSCTAERACKRTDCGATETATATITSKVTIEPECEVMGTTTYTATFTEDWATTQTKDVTDVPVKNHDYDRTQSEANLTRPVLVDGTWTNGYYTYTCKNDANHTIKEEVTRADYTGYETALKNLEDLLKTDITDEAKEAINKAIVDNKLADNLIDSEQSEINKATENLVKAFEDNKGSLQTYTVTFKIEGSTDVVVTVISGQDATAPTNVKKDYDETNHYEFDGWDKAFNNVTSDLTVTAKFKAVEHSYTHTDKDDTYHTDKCACGYSVDVEHTETSAVTEKATCDADGVRTYTCSVCSGTRTEAIAKRAHNYEDNGVAEKATCLKEGVMNTICTNEETETHAACRHESTRAITKLDHSYTGEYQWNEADKTHSQKCVNGCEEYGNVTACTFKSEVTAPTCDVDGYTTHTCTVCNNSYKDSYTTRDHIFVYAPGNGIYHEVSCEYDNCSYKATENCSGGTATCVDKAVCEKCKTAWGEVNPTNHVEIVQVGAKEETCTDIGWNAYEYCKMCDYTTYVEISAKNHAWTVSYEWSEDGNTCTATRACGNDPSHNVTAKATITSEEKIAATCEEMGTTTYTATFTEDWAAEQTKDVKDIPAKNHAWTVSYAWSDDGKTCTATRACGNDAKHNVTATATITSKVTIEPECEVMGTTTYTATFTEDWAATQTKDVTDVPVKNHDYDRTQSEANLTRPVENTDGTWTNGYYTYTCKNDANHTIKEEVTRADYTGYEAALKNLEDLLETDITDEAKEAINEAIEDNKLADNLIGSEQSKITEATANLVKAFEDNNASLKTYTVTFIVDGVEVKSETVISGNDATAPADVTKNFDNTNHYVFSKWDTEFTNVTDNLTVTAEFTAVSHTMGEWTVVEKASCEKDGLKRKDCSDCDYFTTEVIPATNHDMQLTEEKVEPECEVPGKEAVYTCANGCGKTTGGEEIKALEHKWGTTGTFTEDTSVAPYAGYYTYICETSGCELKIEVEAADYSELNGVVTELENIIKNNPDLTDEAKKEIQDAIDEAKALPDNLTKSATEEGIKTPDGQGQIDALVTELEKVVADTNKDISDGSALKPDYSAWESAEGAYDALDKANVKSEVINEANALKAEIAAKQADDTLTQATATQPEINAAADRLNDIIDGINDGSLKDPDYSDVENKINEAKGNDNLNKDTQDKIEEIEKALEEIKNKEPEANAKDDQDDVKALEDQLDEILEDIENGTAIKPDYSEAEKAIQDAESIDGISDADKAIVAELKKQLEDIKNNPESNKTEHQDDVDDIKDAALELVVKYENICRHNGTTKQYITNIMDDNKQNTHSVKCVDCGEIIKTEKCEFKTETVAATCCTDGYTVYTCKLCGYSFKADIVAADENLHKFGRWYDNEASCKEIRTQTRYCDNPGCFVSETVTVLENGKPAYGAHYYVVVPGKDATCTTDGHTPYYRCVTCDEVTESERLPAKGHTDGDKNGNCDRCGYIINHQGRCKCFCHNDAFFVRIFFKIVNFFWKLFKINANCECGSVHW